jgi:hypothetical protein
MAASSSRSRLKARDREEVLSGGARSEYRRARMHGRVCARVFVSWDLSHLGLAVLLAPRPVEEDVETSQRRGLSWVTRKVRQRARCLESMRLGHITSSRGSTLTPASRTTRAGAKEQRREAWRCVCVTGRDGFLLEVRRLTQTPSSALHQLLFPREEKERIPTKSSPHRGQVGDEEGIPPGDRVVCRELYSCGHGPLALARFRRHGKVRGKHRMHSHGWRPAATGAWRARVLLLPKLFPRAWEIQGVADEHT